MQKFNDLRQRYNEYKKTSFSRHSLGGSPTAGAETPGVSSATPLAMKKVVAVTPPAPAPAAERERALPAGPADVELQRKVGELQAALDSANTRIFKLEMEYDHVKSEKATLEVALENKGKENIRLRTMCDQLLQRLEGKK